MALLASNVYPPIDDWPLRDESANQPVPSEWPTEQSLAVRVGERLSGASIVGYQETAGAPRAASVARAEGEWSVGLSGQARGEGELGSRADSPHVFHMATRRGSPTTRAPRTDRRSAFRSFSASFQSSESAHVA